MRGRILGYDVETFKGVLSGHDGQRYDFVDSDWRGTGDPKPGTEVDFQVDSGAAKDIFPFVETVPQPGQPPQAPQYIPPPPQPQYVAPPPQPQYVPPPQPQYVPPQPAFGQQPYPGQPYPPQPGQAPYSQPYPPQPMPGQPYPPGYAAPGYVAGEPHNGGFLHVLFSFHGRISRSEFWLKGVLLGGIVAAVFLIIGVMLDSGMGNINLNDPQDPNVRGPIITILFYLFGALWPGLAMQVKRWHDRDKSGWFVLVSFIPIAGPIWSFIELGFLRGSIGPNRFGSDSVPHY
jgi:uncharacterized membrane protein YhaH (DUF805 family)